MTRRTQARPVEGDDLRGEIRALEALKRRGGITLVIADNQIITVYLNDRRVFR